MCSILYFGYNAVVTTLRLPEALSQQLATRVFGMVAPSVILLTH